MRLRKVLAIAAFLHFVAFAPAQGLLEIRMVRPSRETQAALWKEAMEAAKDPSRKASWNEAARMLAAVEAGGKMDGNTGWWGPSASRYDWTWLAKQFDRNGDGAVSLKEFGVQSEFFASLDRDRNGVVTAEDLDWSEKSAFLKQQAGPKNAGKGKKSGPSKEVLIKAFLDGDAGSPFEGPKVGEPAPNFVLPTYDRKKKIALADFRNDRPVVLVFGSFT